MMFLVALVIIVFILIIVVFAVCMACYFKRKGTSGVIIQQSNSSVGKIETSSTLSFIFYIKLGYL